MLLHLPTGSLHVVSLASVRSSIQTTLVWGLLDSPCMGNQPCPQTSNPQPGIMISYPRTPPWGLGGEKVLRPLPPNHLHHQRSFHPPQPTEVPAPGCKRQGECPLKCVCVGVCSVFNHAKYNLCLLPGTTASAVFVYCFITYLYS